MLFKFTFTSCNIIAIIIRMAFGIMWLPFNTVEYYKICFVIVSSTSSQFLQDKSMPIYPGWSLNDVTLLKRGEILMILKHGRRSKIWNMCNAILYDFKRNILYRWPRSKTITLTVTSFMDLSPWNKRVLHAFQFHQSVIKYVQIKTAC